MREHHKEILTGLLKDGVRTLTACRAAMPYTEGMQGLLEDARSAQERGYFTPEEDERLRAAYTNYLGVRASLWETVQTLLPYIELPRTFKKGATQRQWKQQRQSHLRAFAVAFASAAMLLRSGYYLIDMAADRPVVRDKLDEAEPRYGIARKQFTDIYDSLVSSRRMARYYAALSFYQNNRTEIYNALEGEFAGEFAGEFSGVAEILEFEEPYFETRLKGHIKRKAKFNVFSLRRRRLSAVSKTMFFLFEAVGRDIAELKQPLLKPRSAGKRITDAVRAELLDLVRPGDVFVTRHDDAMSNLFLPGYWPHAALYIGTDSERAQMGIEASKSEHQSVAGEVRFLESKKDGVLFRPAHDTLQVDACVILRPKIPKADMRIALNRAVSHGGKLYDFVFDFASADRLACTELIYRTYNGCNGVDFKLAERAGRQCLSAEDLLNQAVGNDWFEVVALFGVGDNKLSHGADAHARLQKSYDFQPK